MDDNSLKEMSDMHAQSSNFQFKFIKQPPILKQGAA